MNDSTTEEQQAAKDKVDKAVVTTKRSISIMLQQTMM